MYAGIIAMAANVALTVALYLAIGFYGVPAATSIAMVAASGWFVYAMKKETGVIVGELIRKTLAWPVLAVIPGAVLCIVADWQTIGIEGWLPNALAVAAASGCAAVSYLVIIRFVPFLDDFDWRFLDEHLWLRYLPWLRGSRGQGVLP
jgi:peptidoglycan biosynthesis protein MviN/MurJ (putative lipid II flippase)